jgi:bifunctional NMN adenylyltransferase/nudix hydrolase
MFDLLVFIGRFQPFHNEHKRVIDTALSKAHNVLVLVGSAGKARTIRNPFTFEERRQFIYGSIENPCNEGRVHIRPLRDKTYNDTAWVKQVQDIVTTTALDIRNPSGINLHGTGRIGLIGASKDHTSYYLKMFPQWESVNVPIEYDVHATEIRDGYFEDEEVSMAPDIPNNVVDWLNNEFRYTEECEALRREYWFTKKYKEQWEAAPYPVKHLTVDAVVEQSGHILLVKRRSEPGKGLWALPGGHLETDETLEEGVIRELREETGIKVPVPVLRGSIEATHVFDDPHRSNIGRVVTFASYIKLADDTSLPRVRGMDDAEKAKWVPISEIAEDRLFDDHYHIIQYFLGL